MRVQKDDFPGGLLSKVAPRNPALDVLKQALFVAEGEHLTASSTNLEVTVKTRIPISGKPGFEALTVDAHKISSIVNALPEGDDISMSVTKRGLFIKTGNGKSRFRINTLPAEEYPSDNTGKAVSSVTLSQAQLRKMLSLTAFSMAHNDVRYYLNGLLLELQGDTVRCVATDGHRLSLSQTQIDGKVEIDSSVIIPRESVNHLLSLIKDKDDDVNVIFHERHVRFIVGDRELVAKKIDGAFPDYRRVIPEQDKESTIIELDVLAFRDILAKAMVLCDGKTGMALDVKDVLKVKTQAEGNLYEDEMEVTMVSGEGTCIGFFPKYLSEALERIESDKARFVFNGSFGGTLITGMNDDDTQYVVMPLKM